MRWQPSILVQSSSHSRTPSSSPSARSLMPLRTPEALFSLHQDPLSQSNSIRAKPYTLVKGTTCTSSLVRCHGWSFPSRRSNDVSISGLGLASILTRASEVTDSMVEASSLGLAHALTEEEHSLGLLYPRIERSTASLFFLFPHLTPFFLVREISAFIAKEVIRAAQKAVCVSS